MLARTENSSHCNNQLEATVAKLTLNQNAFIQNKVSQYYSGLLHAIQLQLSLTAVPARLDRLASGWLLIHGDSLFSSGMSARKKHCQSSLCSVVTLIHNSEL